ncbi:MAG: hypothetical protein DWQ19_11290 [Crenarchaeota archaeon]|nr:MAG: hypothetical protein DWQ19_11290 [Thermoproteota archaeon]
MAVRVQSPWLPLEDEMRLFRLKNKSGRCFWVVAPTIEAAKEYACFKGYAKNVENLSLIGDQTDFYLNNPGGDSLQEILDDGKSGTVCIQLGETAQERKFKINT